MTFGILLSLAAILGCDRGSAARGPNAESGGAAETAASAGEVVTPPFAVRGELEGLLIVYFDSDGLHTATKRSDVPEAHRRIVRVDSLSVPPERRLDPDFVYVVDLEDASADYPVRKVPRSSFESWAEAARAAPPSPEADGGDVIIYGADWCGACRSAAAYFRQHGVAFVEKNVERDPAAQAEMQEKARAAGVRPSGIPVIDFRGTILTGFDQARLDGLIAGRRTG